MIQENKKLKSLEKIFDKALNLWEKGKSLPEIFDIFPEYQKELKELFEVVDFIKKEKSAFMPRKELLSNILSQIDVLSVTETKESRSMHREEPSGLKGRLSILQVEMEKILNFMEKKVYLLAGAALIIIAVVIGVYWHSRGPELAEFPKTEELSQEIKSLSQDTSDLEIVAEDKNLDTLEEDLLALAEEIPLEQELPPTPAIDISEIENLEKEFSTELEGILNDLTDLEGFEEDASLYNLDDSLSGLAE